MSDENLHHVREVLDDVFGSENFCAAIVVRKTSALNSPVARVNYIPASADFLLWYARDLSRLKYHQLYKTKALSGDGGAALRRRNPRQAEIADPTRLPPGARVVRYDNLISQGYSETLSKPFVFDGSEYSPGRASHWKTTLGGLERLAEQGRVRVTGRTLAYKRYWEDFPVMMVNTVWTDIGADPDKAYVVQTPRAVIARCMLMTTGPGDLVLDPSCGSGTTAYVAEQWGRRWITIDTSRVPLALTRQRLLTATFPYYELQDEARGPASGFVYKRLQNKKGEEVGGIVPHVTLKSIANDEPAAEEVLVDRPEVDKKITRVTGPFVVEATIPTPVDIDGDGTEDSGVEQDAAYLDRMLEALRRNPSLRLPGNRTISLTNVRPPGQSLHPP